MPLHDCGVSGRLPHPSVTDSLQCLYMLATPLRILPCWQVAAQTKPDLIIFVMDGSIGQAAHDQAKAFKDTVEVLALLTASLIFLLMPSNSLCASRTLP